jgi:hypothetical protein
MSGSQLLDAQTADQRIIQLLGEAVGRYYGNFQCRSAIIFLPDPFTGQLEPAFIAPENSLPYRVIESRQDLPDSKLARFVYETRSVRYSLNPAKDELLKPDNGSSGFDFNHSLMACPLDSFTWQEGPIGALVLESATMVAEDPRAAEKDLRDRASLLSTLLWVRKQVRSDSFLQKYQTLALEVLQKLRPIRTLRGTAEDFINFCTTDLGIIQVLLEIRRPDLPKPLFVPDNPTQFQKEAFRTYLNSVAPNQPLVLNRIPRNEHRDLVAKIERAFSAVPRAWAGVRIERGQTTISCLVSRDIRTLSDHWTSHEINLLTHSCELLHELQKRGHDFDSLLQQLRGGREPRKEAGAQFDLLCYVLKEFFDVDQVLTTRVERTPTHHAVVGVRARGFGENDNWIRDDTVRRLPSDQGDPPGKPDVLVYILQKYLDKKPLPEILSAVVGDTSAEFDLRPEVVERCQLKGKLFFLPCCTTTTTGDARLKSILHLGHSRGSLEIPSEVLPLLQDLGTQVADGVAQQERDEVAAKLVTIRNCDTPSRANLELIAKETAKATHSLGCTLFMNAQLLHLIGWQPININDLKDAFTNLLFAARDGHWPDVLTVESCLRLNRMLACFLGLSSTQIESVVHSFRLTPVAKLLAENLYVRVAQSNKPAPGDVLATVLLASLDEPREAAQHLGRFLLEECYVPGFGLTGWVIRYRHSMLLGDKEGRSLEDFFHRISSRIRLPRLAPIIETLQGIEPRSSLREMAVLPPEHADHISEDPDRRNPQDTYLGFPLEEIGDPVAAAGVLRVSNSANLRRSFEVEDEAVVKAAAIHVSHLLRREHMRRDPYVYDKIVRRSTEAAFQHDVSHVEDDVNALVRTVGKCLQGEELSKAQSTLTKLREACVKARQSQVLDELRESIVQVNEANGSKCRLHEYLRKWLRLSELSEFVAEPPVAPTEDETRMNGVVMLALCYVVEEVVRNIEEHRKKTKVCVRVSDDPGVAVLITEFSHLDLTGARIETQGWLPYRDLAQGRSGGGMKLFDLVAALLDITVQYRTEADGQYLYVARLNAE